MKTIQGHQTEYVIRPCTPSEYGTLLRFLDVSFEKKGPRWFEKYYGHIFHNDQRLIADNYLVHAKGRLVGVIGIYPIALRIGAAVLRVGGVGSVSALKEYRGRGVMSFMLKRSIDIMNNDGYDVSWLGGDRYRYKSYGWDLGGRERVLTVRLRDLQRLCPALPKVKVYGVTPPRLPQLARLHQRFVVCAERDSKAWVALMRRKRFIWSYSESRGGSAYLAHCDKGRHISEVQGHPETVLALLAEHMRKAKLDAIEVNYPAQADALCRALFHVASDFYDRCNSQMRVMNPNTTWRKLLPEIRKRHQWVSTAALARLNTVRQGRDKHVLLGRILGHFDDLPSLPPRLARFEWLRPLNWWLPYADAV